MKPQLSLPRKTSALAADVSNQDSKYLVLLLYKTPYDHGREEARYANIIQPMYLWVVKPQYERI